MQHSIVMTDSLSWEEQEEDYSFTEGGEIGISPPSVLLLVDEPRLREVL